MSILKSNDLRAVAQVYANWYDVPDWDAVEIFDKWKRQRGYEKKSSAH